MENTGKTNNSNKCNGFIMTITMKGRALCTRQAIEHTVTSKSLVTYLIIGTLLNVEYNNKPLFNIFGVRNLIYFLLF